MIVSASHERMLTLLAQTHLYDLTPNSRTWTEFKQYAPYFDYWYNRLDDLLKNIFVSTVSNDYFAAYRKLFNIPNGVTPNDAKQIISARLAVTNLDFTVEGVKRCLASGGIEAELTENFVTNKVTVKILSDKNVFGNAEIRAEFIQSCMPCQVEAVIA